MTMTSAFKNTSASMQIYSVKHDRPKTMSASSSSAFAN